jgi:hypothetical protein
MWRDVLAYLIVPFVVGNAKRQAVEGSNNTIRRARQSHKDQIEHATTAADIERIVNAGKIAAFLTVEGGHTIDDDLRVMRMYYQLGIRSMTLTHSRNNNWADSATDEPAHNGLTDFGKEVVREMNRLGMVVDVSHVADKTFYVPSGVRPMIETYPLESADEAYARMMSGNARSASFWRCEVDREIDAAHENPKQREKMIYVTPLLRSGLWLSPRGRPPRSD